MVILMDTSRSDLRSESQWNQMVLYINGVLDLVPDVSPEGVHIGLARYSSLTYPVVFLDDSYSVSQMQDAVRSLRQDNKTADLALALREMRTSMLKSSKGSRKQDGVPQMVLLLLDQFPSDDQKDEILREADLLKDLDVHLLVVGLNVLNDGDHLLIKDISSRNLTPIHSTLPNFEKDTVREMESLFVEKCETPEEVLSKGTNYFKSHLFELALLASILHSIGLMIIFPR